LNQFYWILGGLIGSIAGSLIPFSFTGIDFALTALFVVLLMDQLRRTRDPVPAAIGIASAVIALVLVGPRHMLLAALAGALALLALARGRNKC
jgi:4-azaleucine resistance transporter AzlC